MTEVAMDSLVALTLMRYLDFALYWERVSSSDWARVLATFSLFRRFGRRRLRKLVRHATFLEFAPGETVNAPDSLADSLYVILGGTARARGQSATRVLHVGDYFGEAGFFAGGERATTIVARDALHVMRLPLRTYVRFARHVPASSFARLRNRETRFRPLEIETARC
jgi:signal-transduction protein with cAMP-binding, CBS, and nucleotidyltransferase domain